MDLANQVKDLEFQLRRTQKENKTQIKEILHQILEVKEGLEKLLAISLREEWPAEAKKFVDERFSLVNKKLLQLVQRNGAMLINSSGQPANQEYHEVVGKVARQDVPSGQIVEVEREGYMYEGDVLRLARVVIAAADGL